MKGEFGMRKAEGGMKGEFGMRKAECGMKVEGGMKWIVYRYAIWR